MTCREFDRRLGDLFERRLASEQRKEARAHLLQCPGCTLAMQRYEETVTLARSAYDDEETPLPEEIVRSIVASVRPMRRSSTIRGLVHLISGIAASQLIVFYLGR